MKYLDYDGLSYLFSKLKSYFVKQETGKGLSTNDYTSAEQTKLSGIATGAEVNKIDTVKVNGTALTITNKAVDVTVPTKVSDLTNDSAYITLSQVPEGAAASTATPLMDGTAAVGTSAAFARGDHRHPSDTSRVPTSRTINGKALTANITLTEDDIGVTHYDSKNVVGATTATSNTTTALTNGNVYLNSVENGAVTSSHKISGSGATTVTTDTNGNIVISSTDSNTTYSAATTSAAGLMSAADKTKLNAITESADAVSFSQTLTSGTEVGKITINGSSTTLYAPTDTDTHYTSKNVVGSNTATSNTTSALTNGNVYLNSVENGAVTSTHKISGSGATTVTTDASGNIVISSTDNNTTYSNGTGISLSGTTFSLATSGATAGSYGPSADVSGTNNATMSVPYITVDTYGRITSISNKTYTAKNTTYSAATTSAAGLMSAADKTKLDNLDTTIASAVAGAGHLTRSVVTALPTTNIDTNTIYMILDDSSSTDNKYIEWMYINNAWEKTGDTDVDLSGYVQSSNVIAITNTEIDTVIAS